MRTSKHYYHRVDFPVHEDKPKSQGNPNNYDLEFRLMKVMKPRERKSLFRKALIDLEDTDRQIVTDQITRLASANIEDFGTAAATEVICELALFLAMQDNHPAPQKKRGKPLPHHEI